MEATLTLPHTLPYGWPALLAFLAARAIPGVEEVVGGAYRRTLALGAAEGVVEVRPAAAPAALQATLQLSRKTPLGPVGERLRRQFDLDADSAAIDAHLAGDPLLAASVAARPGLRVPGAWDPFELVVRAILGQQVSVAAARTLAGRLAQRFGAPLRVPGCPSLTHAFPGPEVLATADLTGLAVTGARARALGSIARAVLADPGLLEPGHDLETTVARLIELPGIGPWTAHSIAMRALRQRDAFPEGDLALVRAMGAEGGAAARAEALRRADRWRPFRAYAVFHLWSSGSSTRGASLKE